MELQEFVADALDQIAGGVFDAIRRQDEAGGVARIAPIMQHGRTIDWSAHVHNIDFDLAVTVTSKVTAEGKAGGTVLTVLNLGVEGAGSRESSMVNRVKFSVPLILPGHLTDTDASPTGPKQ